MRVVINDFRLQWSNEAMINVVAELESKKKRKNCKQKHEKREGTWDLRNTTRATCLDMKPERLLYPI